MSFSFGFLCDLSNWERRRLPLFFFYLRSSILEWGGGMLAFGVQIRKILLQIVVGFLIH